MLEVGVNGSNQLGEEAFNFAADNVDAHGHHHQANQYRQEVGAGHAVLRRKVAEACEFLQFFKTYFNEKNVF
jgi:hypothetical protein